MRPQLVQRTLLSLVLGLLFLSTAATGKCSGKYHELLQQLQSQADLMQDTSTLLDPYIHFQGLDQAGLKEHCKESPGAFPSEDTLRGLSQRGFLRTLNATLGHVLHRLTALQQDLTIAQDQGRNIRGFRSNIHCMSQLLRGSSEVETAEPTQPGPEATLPPTPSSDTFQHKLQGCRFLRGYHRFMHSAGQVFKEWADSRSRSRSRRHRPPRALQRGARRMRPFRRDERLMPRGQLPR
ncbi:oncostatin-M isoform X2 [Camelus dromedarius]|uniref:oncostatin-M isoform X2 n=1 Tax=Camelus dromedarius TaxID=9838 RepID=UPI003119B26C